MRTKSMATLATSMMVLTTIVTGCKSYVEAPSADPDPGSIRVSVTSFGLGVDPDGYDLVIGTQPLRHIDRFAQVSLADLPPGEYDVLISGLDEGQECQVDGKNPLRIAVSSGEEAKVSIVVYCNPNPPGGGCDPNFGDCLRLPMALSGPPLRDRE